MTVMSKAATMTALTLATRVRRTAERSTTMTTTTNVTMRRRASCDSNDAVSFIDWYENEAATSRDDERRAFGTGRERARKCGRATTVRTVRLSIARRDAKGNAQLAARCVVCARDNNADDDESDDRRRRCRQRR